MTKTSAVIAPSNPFSTRFVRPGAIPFSFPTGQNIQTLITRLAAQNWWGQIIGPHGTGKSTLIAELIDALSAAGREPRHYRLRQGENAWSILQTLQVGLHLKSILIIDGYEQLSLWRRWRVRRACLRAGSGLLVTAHAPIGLPDLYRTQMDTELAGRVLSHLLRDASNQADFESLAQQLQIRQGNLRDALFDMYDLYERGRVE